MAKLHTLAARKLLRGTSHLWGLSRVRQFILLQLLGESASLLSRRPKSAFCRIHIRAMQKHRHIFASPILGDQTFPTSACLSAPPPTRSSDVQARVTARPTSSNCPPRFLCPRLKGNRGLWLGPPCRTRGTAAHPASWEGGRQRRAGLRLPQALGSAKQVTAT